MESIAQKYAKTLAEVEEAVEFARRCMTREQGTFAVYERGKTKTLRVVRLGVGPILVTRYDLGLSASPTEETETFYLFNFEITDDTWTKYSVVVRGTLDNKLRPTVFEEGLVTIRIDSGCETGQVFHDATCECREQLLKAMGELVREGGGLIVNIPRQDGRGMGLPFKLATLYLQDSLGVDTVESAQLLEPSASRDVRDYAGVVAILRFLGAKSSTTFRVLTNNEKKLAVFQENGFQNLQVRGLAVEPTIHTQRHLAAKRDRLGHKLPPVAGQEVSQLVRLRQAIEVSRGLCVGIDPDPSRFPASLRGLEKTVALRQFLACVLDVVVNKVRLFKLNRAFFDEIDPSGNALRESITSIHSRYAEAFVILDMKCCDTPNSMQRHVQFARSCKCDGFTIIPFFGDDVLATASEVDVPMHFEVVRGSSPGSDLAALASTRDGVLWETLLAKCAQRAQRGEHVVPIVAIRSGTDQGRLQDIWPSDYPILVPGMGVQGLNTNFVRELYLRGWKYVFSSASRSILSCFDPQDRAWPEAIDRSLDRHISQLGRP